MTHFGLLCPPVTSHLKAMTALGWELKQRGHSVTLFAMAVAQPFALIAGLNFWEIGTEEIGQKSLKNSLAKLGELTGIAAAIFTRNLRLWEVKLILTEAPAAIKAAGIDVLLIDQFTAAGSTVAELLQIPFITVCNALPMNQERGIPPSFTPWDDVASATLREQSAWWAHLRNDLGYFLFNYFWQPIKRALNDYRQQWHLPLYTHPDDANSKILQLSQSLAEFEFSWQHLPPYFHFTGLYQAPINYDPGVSFPWERLTGQPLVYCSMGTLQNRFLSVFELVAAACEKLDVQLVISLGGGGTPESLPKLPGSPLVFGYVPQGELLKKTAMTVTHGGLNTTLESLNEGVPLLAIPITNDQPGVGARLLRSGAGEMISLSQLRVSSLRNVMQKVLTESQYINNAVRLQKAIHDAGGSSRAADLILQAIRPPR